MKTFVSKAVWLLGISLIFACSSGNQKQSKVEETSAAKHDTVSNCYVAIFEGDTAKLKVNLIDSNTVEGTLHIKYAQKPQNDGTIKGSFKGDTLWVDYSFKTGNNPQEYSNPLAFLKKGNDLAMGVGVIETYMGRSYFAKDKPINFERGKFNFSPQNCK
jgi:hypothetical protein